MWIIQPPKIVAGVVGNLQISYTNGTGAQNVLAFRELSKFLGNVRSFEHLFHTGKKSLGARDYSFFIPLYCFQRVIQI